MRFILLRHEQTEWNQQRRLQGWLDSKLTVEGIARLQQSELPPLDNPVIVSSDLGRALDSAKIVSERIRASIIPDRRLRERCFGILDGEVVDDKTALADAWHAYHHRYTSKMQHVEGVETELDFESRISSFIVDMSQRYLEQDIVIISHGEWIRAFMNIINGIESWHQGQGIVANGSPMIIDFEAMER